MIVHLVLFTPRADLADADRQAFAGALDEALTRIPSIRRFQIGRRVLVGAAYEQSAGEGFEYCGIFEFDDRAGLDAYLAHTGHAELGRLFHVTSARTLVHDFETVSSDVPGTLRRWSDRP
jgi:Stress responsive A/B Barrel Domain